MKPTFLFVAALSMVACTGHRQPALSSNDSLPIHDSAAASNTFFPVAAYLESEILGIDRTPIALKKWVIRKNRRDSSFISVPEFNALALQFLPPELRDNNLQKNFTETAFTDNATESVIFTYSPIDENLPLRRVDVTTKAGVSAQQVKSVYMEKNRKAGDSVIIQKLFWETGKSFQIVTLVRRGNGPLMEEQVKVIWGSEEVDQ